MPKNYMIGNWKMNQSISDIDLFFSNLGLENNQNNFWVAPQSIHIDRCIELGRSKGVLIGAQNISDKDSGAFTGECSAEALMELGAHFCVIGHSERRQIFNESNEFINLKVKKSIDKGLVPVLCCGETLEQRENGQTFDVVLEQVKLGLTGVSLNNFAELIVAYEPVWAIGTGKTASPEQAQEVHAEIRKQLIDQFGELGQDLSILYGGSVKPENVESLISKKDINGGLVGGASLKAESFNKLCSAI